MLATWQIIALWVLVPLALFFAARCLLLLAVKWIGPATVMQMIQPGPSQAWIKQQQSAYRSYNTTPKPVTKPLIVSRPLPRKSATYQVWQSATYQQFLKKDDYS